MQLAIAEELKPQVKLLKTTRCDLQKKKDASKAGLPRGNLAYPHEPVFDIKNLVLVHLLWLSHSDDY